MQINIWTIYRAVLHVECLCSIVFLVRDVINTYRDSRTDLPRKKRRLTKQEAVPWKTLHTYGVTQWVNTFEDAFLH